MVGTHIVSRPLAICATGARGRRVRGAGVAQTGQIRGKVTDANNKPVEGAKVTLQQLDNNSKFELTTKKNGEFMQIGLPPGQYKITAEKEGLTASKTSRISLDMAEVNLTLTKGGGASTEGGSKEDRAKAEAKVASIKAALLRSGNARQLRQVRRGDRQVQRGHRGRAPNCTECYIGIGSSNAAKKDYAAAEAAYKKALEIDPNSADAYNGLATIYNDQKKFAEAKEMSAEAMKRVTAAERTGTRIRSTTPASSRGTRTNSPRRRSSLRRRLPPIPNHAESHFMLGQVRPESGQIPGGGERIRDLHQDRADRTERRESEVELRNAQGLYQVASAPTVDASILANLQSVRSRLDAAARRVGRDPTSIRLIAVSKTFSASTSAPPGPQASTTSGRTKFRRGCRRSARRPT